jgi:hypothetical protein
MSKILRKPSLKLGFLCLSFYYNSEEIKMSDLNEINSQILELQTKRDKLFSEKEQSKIDEFKKLEWTKDQEVFLKIPQLLVTGLPAYILLVPGLKIHFHKDIFIYGDESKNYENNIMFGRSYPEEYFGFFTSCSKTLIEFLDKVKFKKVHYNEMQLAVLSAAERANAS